MTPSLNPILEGRYPLIDLLFDLEIAKERQRVELLSGTYTPPNGTIADIKKELTPYCN